jgi:phosphoserine phosphatase RsbU/P
VWEETFKAKSGMRTVGKIDREMTTRSVMELSRMERLEMLVQINSMINSSLDFGSVLREILECAKRIVGADAASIMLRDEQTGDLLCLTASGEVGGQVEEEYRIPRGKGLAGWVAEHQKPLRIKDAYEDRRFNPAMDAQTGYRTQSMLCVPLIAKGRLQGVAQVINKKINGGIGPFTEEDEELFCLFSQQAGLAIDNACMHQKIIKQERLNADLKIAREIQKDLLPAHPFESEYLEIFGYYQPSFQVGGDMYDYFLLPRNRLAIVIGDVSGKGVSAALYMARVISELRALAHHYEEPALIIKALNKLHCERSRFGMFVTLIFGILDLKTFQLDFVLAGHPDLCIYHSDGRYEFVEAVRNRPVGIFEDSVYDQNRVSIHPGEVVLWYSDGIVEVTSPKGEDVERYWLGGFLEDLTLPARKIAQKIIDSVHRFGGQDNFYDDLTLLVMKRKEGEVELDYHI